MKTGYLAAIAVGALALACGPKNPAPPENAADVAASTADEGGAPPADEMGKDAGTAEPGSAEPGAEAAPAAEGGAADASGGAAPSGPAGGSADLQAYVAPQGPSKTFEVITENLATIKSCYFEALNKQPDLKGRVEIEFTVNMKGKISKAKVKSSELTKKVDQCIIKEVKKLTYPKPKYAPETFVFPFDFTLNE